MSSRQLLLHIFNTRLGSVPTRAESELFSADLARTSHELLKSALSEMEGRAAKTILSRDLRSQTIAIFHRKLAEQSRLFPLFFVFETAFRAYVATRLEAIYTTDQWWKPIEAEIVARRTPVSLGKIHGVSMPRPTVRTIEHILVGAAASNHATFSSGYDVVAAGTMAHVGKLIEQHWSEMVYAFSPKHKLRSQGRMTSLEFKQLFTLVREARNDLYHHRAVSRQRRVVGVIEELLDVLDLNIGDIYAKVNVAPLNPLSFKVPMEPRFA